MACAAVGCSLDVYGRQPLCKPHYMKAWRAKNRAHHDAYMWRYGLRRRHGMTEQEFDVLFERQGGACVICSRAFKGTRGCHVDHNHETGHVRGLLCHGCNTGIGLLGEDRERISRVLDYLEKGR